MRQGPVGRSLCPTFPSYDKNQGTTAVTSAGLTVTQTLFNGFQTANRTRQAEGQVFSARETLRTTEQTTLLNAATAYMNLLRDAAILELQRSNVEVLAGATAPDPRPVQRRRSDAHRRRAIGIAAGRRPLATAHRGIELHHLARDLSPGDRRRARHARRRPRRSIGFRRESLDGAIARGARASIRPSPPRCTTSTSAVVAGQDRRGRALSDASTLVGNAQKTYGSTGALDT